MKILLPALLIILASLLAEAQNSQNVPVKAVQRNIRFRILGKDSVNLDLNEKYQMIEDSCSVIIRRGHLNNTLRKFTGRFTDVNKVDPSIVLSSGTYDNNGLKTGQFTAYNLDGTLKAKGSYRNDKFDGNWEINYDDGKPALLFTGINDTISIASAWDKTGKKTVDKGKGTYTVNQGGVTWKGKLENGRPNGTWNLYRTDDAAENMLAHEIFVKNVFKKGANAIKDYDASRIVLVDAEMLPYLNAEKLMVAPPCNTSSRKHVVNAQYENGRESFTGFLETVMGDYLKNFDMRRFSGTLVLEGVITEDGIVSNMQPVTIFDDNSGFVRGLTYQFHKVPNLNPATVDGKPVKQKFRISFTFSSGVTHWVYRFLPIDPAYLK